VSTCAHPSGGCCTAAVVTIRAARQYAARAGFALTLLPAIPLPAIPLPAQAASEGRRATGWESGLPHERTTGKVRTAGAAGTALHAPAIARATTSRSGSTGLSSLHPPGRHDVHLTYSRVEIDGGRILWRVRLFRDDLETALRAHTGTPVVTASTPATDSVFAAYFNAEVPVTVNGARLTAMVLESGRDLAATDSEMWWYLLELTAPPPVRTLSVRVGLLFRQFADQRNIVTVVKTPGEHRQSMYFVRDDPKGQTLNF